MTAAITITYDLNPPSSVDTTGLQKIKTLSVALNDDRAEGPKGYYQGLRTALAEAKSLFGEDLTVWRDRVGKDEVGKEPAAKDEEDEDAEDEDEQGGSA